MNKHYSKIIRDGRRRIGLSQSELAKLIHVSQQSIAKYETGKAEPNIESLVALSKALGTPVSYFFNKSMAESEEEFLTLYRSLNAEDTQRTIDYMKLLKKQEVERTTFKP